MGYYYSGGEQCWGKWALTVTFQKIGAGGGWASYNFCVNPIPTDPCDPRGTYTADTTGGQNSWNGPVTVEITAP